MQEVITLPMSLGDRVFWSIATMILIGIIWVKFIEKYLNAWWALVVGLVISAFIIKYGGKEISLRSFLSRRISKKTTKQ